MFDEVHRAAERAGTGGVPTRYDRVTEELSFLLFDGEQVQHVLVTTKTIEHTEDSRTMTIDAGSGHHVHVVATNQRVLCLVGGQAEIDEPDVALDLREVTEAEYNNSLLSSSVFVATENESIDFTPTEGAPEAFVPYVDRVSSNFAEQAAILEEVREAMKAFERRRADGVDTQPAVDDVESGLERARELVSGYNNFPDELMHADIDRVAAEFEALRSDSRVQHLEEGLDAAAAADDYETICEHLREVAENLTSTRTAVDDEDVHASLDDVEAKLDERASEFIDAAATVRRDGEQMDALAAVERYDDARERFEAAATVADSVEAFEAADVRERHQEVTVELYEALQDKAEHLEAAGDDANDDVDDEYERAKSALERARDLADDVPDADPADFEEDFERLEEAIERSKWEWGKT